MSESRQPPAGGHEHPVRAVGRRLEVLRKRRGWTYREMAALAGVPVNTLHRWIRRRRRGWDYYELRGLVENLGEAWDARWEQLWRQAAEAEPITGQTVAAAPFQVPADTAHFTGRSGELRQLLNRWPADDTVPATVVVSAVTGMAGVGKTALAVHAAHRLAHRFCDGVLFVDLHGFTPGVEPTPSEQALDYLLRGLGVPGQQIPPGTDARAALYRSVLARRRVLIVLDNAADETQVRPLLPGTPGCLVLVTSRRRLAALDEATPVDLDTLPPDDAAALFTAIAGTGRDPVVEEIVALCGHLPLAIRIAAARLRQHPAWAPRHLADLLSDQHARLAELDDGTRSITAALTVSHRHLTDRQRHAFALLGLHPGVDIEAHALAALADTTLDQAQHLLDDLERVNLAAQPTYHRYTLHDLVRAHAAKQPAPDHDAAIGRLLRYYAYTATAATDVMYPYETSQRPRAPRPGTPTPAFGGQPEAEKWLDTELDNLLAVATSDGTPDHTLHQSATLHRCLRTRARYEDAVALHEHALAAAHTLNDPAGELAALNGLGDIHYLQRRHEAAADRLRQALDIARRTGNRDGELTALNGRGNLNYSLGRYEQAIECHRQALDIARATGNHTGEQTALAGLGHVHWSQGRYEQAIDRYRQALDIARATGNHTGEQTALAGLGHVHYLRGRYDAAADSYQQVLRIAHATGHRTGILQALNGLGAVHRMRARYERATGCFEQVLRISREVGDPHGELNALTSLAWIHQAQSSHERAARCFDQVLRLATEVDDRNYLFEALHGLARIHHATGSLDRALACGRRALDLADELGHPADQARVHDGLAHTHHALGQHGDARPHWERALGILTDLGVDHTEDGVTVAEIRTHLADLEVHRAGPV